MPSTYSTNLGIELIATGEQSGTWGATTNSNLGTLIEQAISGYASQAITDGADTAITLPNGATGVARNMSLELTGTLTAARNLIVPAKKKLYFIYNNTSGGYAVTVKVSGLTGVSVPNGKKMVLVCNGTDVVEAINYASTLGASTLTASTGTITTLGSTSAVIGSPTDGNKGSGSINAEALYVGGVAVGTGNGSVTSVDVSGGSTGLTTSGGPVTGSGVITIAGTLAAASGGTGQTSYTTGDLLYASGTTTLSKLADIATGNALISGGVGVAPSWGKIALTTHVSGTLPVANGGTGVTASTGTGSVVLNTSPSLSTSATLALTDAGAGVGPSLTLDRNSSSPADNDALGSVIFTGRDSGAATQQYAEIGAVALDVTAATEDGAITFKTTQAGSSAERMSLQGGLVMSGATGGDKGSGTINATNLYVNGSAVATGSSISWYQSSQLTISATTGSVSHGLGAVPDIIQLWIVNITTEQGFSPGDWVLMNSNLSGSGQRGATLWATSTSVGYSQNAANQMTVCDKSGGAAAQITDSKWRVVLKAAKFV